MDPEKTGANSAEADETPSLESTGDLEDTLAEGADSNPADGTKPAGEDETRGLDGVGRW